MQNISLCFVFVLCVETVLEKDRSETDRIVKGVVAKEIHSDIKGFKKKIDDTGLQAKVNEEQVLSKLDFFFITLKIDEMKTGFIFV